MEETINRKAVIRCQKISKSFVNKKGEVNKVIQDIDLEVYENEFVVLFGPGQCGKSTLIYIMAGLEAPSQGTVHIDNVLVEGPGPDRGVVYQETWLFPWLTVMGNVEFGLKARGIDLEARRKHAQNFIDLVGLTGFEKSHPNKLSGGMQQRVGIARAYANDPKVMLMDEPFGHLDAQTRYLMEEELEKIWTNEKRTVVFVTNNIEEAIFLADRIVLLTNPPAQVRAEYKVDLPRPRNLTDPKFLALRKEISKQIDVTL